MMKPRNLLLLIVMSAAIIGPGTAMAADEPSTATTVPTINDPSSDAGTSSDAAPLTLSPEQIDALQEANDSTDDNKSVFEKASDFVTDHAPWFIIGIIVLAAIIAGILIMRGRPRRSKATGTPKASKSNKAMRAAGGTSQDQPAQVPSASELRRRKRAAIQRSREEERLRRKAGIEDRKAARRGGPAAPVAAAAAGATAVTAAGAAVGAVDPVEAEKQAARDQETAAAAVARFGAVQAPVAEGQTVPAPVSPSQTAPAAGVVTPGTAPDEPAYLPEAVPFEQPIEESPIEPDTVFEPAAEPQVPEALPEPVAEAPEPEYAESPVPEAETSVLHEPSIENPGADAAVGNAAQDFLAGGAAGAAGGFAIARSSQDAPESEPAESLEPVIAPEPGMAAEYAVADSDPVEEAPVEPEPAVESARSETGPGPVMPGGDDRLRAKVAELKATQEPSAPEPAPSVSQTDLSPGLAAVERRLSENSEERDRALKDAEDRLRRIEQRAEDAERRAAFAERLAQLKVEESEREKRLNDVVTGIDRAEQRARDAEARAEAAERAAAAALEKSDLNLPAPDASGNPEATSPEPVPTAPAAPEPPASQPAAPEASGLQPPTSEARQPERRGLFGEPPSKAPAGGSSDAVNLNSATFEELREAGLSVTQATRILAYRERFGGYGSVEDLEKVPGFPTDLIESLRARLTI